MQDDLSRIQDGALRDRLERLAGERVAKQRNLQLSVSEPWLAPSGEQLAATVGNRMLTMPQLRQRVAAALTQAPPIDEGTLAPAEVKRLAEDRQVAYEDRILADWVENTSLAVYAEKFGLTASNEEVQKALNDLSNQAPGPGGAAPQPSRLVGFREDELRQELRDGLLAEKVVRLGIAEVATEPKLRAVYNQRPDLFTIPTRVRAWQIFYPVIHLLSKGEEKDIQSKLNAWRKKLAKAKTDDDFKALQKEMGGTAGLIARDAALVQLHEARTGDDGKGADPTAIRQAGMQAAALGDPDKPVLNDLGWVAEGDPMPAAMQEQLFRLDAGDTSDIFKSESAARSLGYNVVKVLERVKGERGTFEQARPRVENMVYDQVKDMVYQAARLSLEIHSDSAGLLKWRKLDPGELPAGAAATASSGAGALPAVTLPEPDLSPLRGGGRTLSPTEAALMAPVPSVSSVVKGTPAPRGAAAATPSKAPASAALPPVPPPQPISPAPQK